MKKIIGFDERTIIVGDSLNSASVISRKRYRLI